MRSVLVIATVAIAVLGAIAIGFLTGLIAVDGSWVYVGPFGSDGVETSTAWESWFPGRYL